MLSSMAGSFLHAAKSSSQETPVSFWERAFCIGKLPVRNFHEPRKNPPNSTEGLFSSIRWPSRQKPNRGEEASRLQGPKVEEGGRGVRLPKAFGCDRPQSLSRRRTAMGGRRLHRYAHQSMVSPGLPRCLWRAVLHKGRQAGQGGRGPSEPLGEREAVHALP